MSITTNTGPITFYRGEDPLKASKLNEAFSERVLRLGDTMLGKLVLATDPTDPLDSVTKQYVDRNFIYSLNAAYLQLAGGTMNGYITLHAPPTDPMHAVNKQYVDTAAASIGQGVYLPLAGGTLTGALFLPADPTALLQAATKQYVDSKVSSVIVDWNTLTGKPATFPPTLPIPESGVTNLVADLASKEPTITAGTTAQYWRGDKTWQTFPTAPSGASVTVSDTPPATPAQGDMWFDSVGTQLYLRYNDGTSNQWVVANNQLTSAVPAPSSTLPLIEGTAAIGSLLTYARADHVHPAQAAGGVTSFNSRTGAVTLTTADVTTVADATYVNITGDTMTGALTVTNGLLVNGASDPRITFTNSSGAANQKKVDIYASTTQFAMQFVNDAFNAGTGFFSATRPGTGYGVASVALTAPGIYFNGATNTSGDSTVNGGVYVNATGTNYGFVLFASGGNGDRNIRFTTDNWRLTWQIDGTLAYYNPGGSPLWYVTASGAMTNVADATVGGNLYVTSGVFAVASGYYLGRSGVDGAWRFFENNVVTFTLDTGGSLTLANNLVTTNSVQAVNGQMFFGNAGSGRIMQVSPQWYWDWHIATGTLIWMNPNRGAQWVMLNNGLCYNDWTTVGGHGPYQDYSDERAKADIQPARVGLDEVLKLEPIRFRRIRVIKDEAVTDEREDVGFSAQQVRGVIPEAVTEMGFTLPDGTDGTEDGATSLGLGTTAIVAALVNAVKTLTDRITALEAPSV